MRGGFNYFWNSHPYLGKILTLTIIFAKELKPPTSSMLRGQNGSKTFFFFSKKSRVSFEKSTEEQIGVSDTDDSVSEASMATDETGGIRTRRKRRASDGFHLKNYFVSLTKQNMDWKILERKRF